MDSGTNIARSMGAAALLSLLAACGGGGGGGNSSVASPPPTADNILSSTHKPTLTGRFADTAISGLHYSSANASGTTDAQGQFQYQPGDLITFKIGDIALPPVVGRPDLRLTDFQNDVDEAQNIAWFLLSLDTDGKEDNGIAISEQAHRAAAGKTLDWTLDTFDDDTDPDTQQFKAAANPIIAAAGGANIALVPWLDAADHLDLVRGKFGPVNSVVGGWISKASGASRAIVFLENGMYYSLEANCNGVPGYEFGSYTYSAGKIQFTATADVDGTACGMNTGSQSITLSGDGDQMSLAGGSNWQRVGTGYANGVFYAKGVLGNPTDHAFTLVLLGQDSFAAIDSGCGGSAAVEFGDYTSSEVISLGLTTIVSATPTTVVTSNNACSVTTLFSSIMARAGQALVDTVKPSPALIEIRPSYRSALLVGGWISKPNNGITFTTDGRYLFTDTEPTCIGGAATSGGEKGTYSWDTVNSNASLHVDIDNDGSCGYADLGKGSNSGVGKLKVDGNLLTLSNGSRQDVLVRNSASDYGGSWSGLWTRREAAGLPRLTLSSNNSGRISPAAGDVVSVSSLDSDCSSAQSFSLEQISLLVQGYSHNSVELATPDAFQTFIDQPGCGLSPTVGPTYQFSGDTLTIDGWGTFVREL